MEVFDNTPNGQGKRYGVTVDLSRTECQTACACLRLRTIVRAEIAASVFETEICDFRQGTPKIHRELRAPEQSIRTIVRSYWSPMRLPDFEQTIKLFGITGAMGTFIWGVFVWRDKAIEDRAAIAREQKSVAITRKIEATRPFLEQQLAIYVDAIQTVETIASSQSQTEIGISTAHFWRLYWGELALVEDKNVEAAAKRIKKALDDQNGKREPRELEQVSLNLALACRLSLDRSWAKGYGRKTRPQENRRISSSLG